jgi:hypothetical protein
MYADQIDNEARRDIFLKLCKADFLRYSELKPPEMESNHFAYHLKKLKEDGFIRQDEGTGLYTLAPKGLRLADILSFKTELIRTQPKIVILIIAKNVVGSRVLIGVRQRQPYYGQKVFPAGKVHFGERLEDAEKRTLEEFLPSAEFSLLRKRGKASMIYKKDSICVSHIYCHVYAIQLNESSQETLPKSFQDQSSALEWEDIAGVGSSSVWLEGTKQLLEKVEADGSFEEEFVFES